MDIWKTQALSKNSSGHTPYSFVYNGAGGGIRTPSIEAISPPLRFLRSPLPFFPNSPHLEANPLNQKQIDAAAVILQIVLSGLALNFDADFHELEEITKRALLQIEQEDH